MTYEYECEECGEVTSLQLSMKEEIPSKIICEKCGSIATRVWGNSLIKIPEHMKAFSDINDGGYADFDNLKSRFKHGARPSGKEKVYY